MLRSHLHCDIETGGHELPVLGVHCLHLAARFGDRNKGEARRIREIGAVLTDIADEPALPHILIGDFNALSPGDDILATSFFRRMNNLRRAGLLVSRPNGILVPLDPDAKGESNGLADRWRRARGRSTTPRWHSRAAARRLAADRGSSSVAFHGPAARSDDRTLDG